MWVRVGCWGCKHHMPLIGGAWEECFGCCVVLLASCVYVVGCCTRPRCTHACPQLTLLVPFFLHLLPPPPLSSSSSCSVGHKKARGEIAAAKVAAPAAALAALDAAIQVGDGEGGRIESSRVGGGGCCVEKQGLGGGGRGRGMNAAACVAYALCSFHDVSCSDSC